MEYSNEEGFQIIFRVRKMVFSKAHKKCFEESMEWPENNGMIKLRKIDGGDDKVECYRSVEGALAEGMDGIKYKCHICLKFHDLDLVASTTVWKL